MSREFKVCLCGGSGGIGQPLAALLATNPYISELSVQDVNVAGVPPEGVAADLSHLMTPCKVRGYGTDPKLPMTGQMKECLAGCHLVVVAAGMPRKPGMTRDDLFGVNASIAGGIVAACAEHCPTAVIALITNPVNSIVPAMCELYRQKGLDVKKICGITMLDGVRANKFVGEMLNINPEKIHVPVVGGHAGETILPLFSKCQYASQIPAAKIIELDKRVQNGGTEVVEAKGGKGSATLSMAFAGSLLANHVLQGLSGRPSTCCAYVPCDFAGFPPYFALQVTFGSMGLSMVHPIDKLSAHEEERLASVKKQIINEIATGVNWAKGAATPAAAKL